jgi:GT2 family glycosyltransferase
MNDLPVDIVIVNWNTGQLLARCIQALEALPEKSLIHHAYVVDNASKDDSLEEAVKVPTSFALDCIRSTVNLGFSKANNLGLEKIRTSGAQTHILLLNPDTEMQPGCLTALLEALKRHPLAGVVGPRLLNADKSLQPSVRAFPTFAVFLSFFLKLQHVLSKRAFWQHYMQTHFDYSKEQSVDQVMGAVFLIRHEAWKKIGDLDDHYWIWFEEVDYCQRAKRAGWEVWYTPTGETMHYGAASFHQLVGLRRTWPFIQSSLVYTGIYEEQWQFMILWLLTPIALLLALPASLAHIRQKQHNAAIRYEH